MKAAIVGTRDITNIDIEKYLIETEEYLSEKITLVISGGARGIDTLAEEYADKRGIPKQIFLPDYRKHGRGAPIIRNISIIKAADVIIAFWDGESKGTKFVINYAKNMDKKVFVYGFHRGPKQAP